MEMILNHLLIGVQNLQESLSFYEKALGFTFKRSFVDTGTGGTGAVLGRKGSPDLLLVPFKFERLPSPQHMAFEVSQDRFKGFYEHLLMLGLKIRSRPSLDHTEAGIGRLVEEDLIYDRFFFVDPNQVNIEIMTKVREGCMEEPAREFQLDLFTPKSGGEEKPHP